MKYPIYLTQRHDEYEPSHIWSQILKWDCNGLQGKVRFADLNEAPEDAIIGRDLFDAEDYLAAVRFGIALGKLGYTDLYVIQKDLFPQEEEHQNENY